MNRANRSEFRMPSLPSNSVEPFPDPQSYLAHACGSMCSEFLAGKTAAAFGEGK
jgi:hypothetical protein